MESESSVSMEKAIAVQVIIHSELHNSAWDKYVQSNPAGNHCHLYAWKNIIENSYGIKGYYLQAVEDEIIRGIVPLFHFKSYLFGNQLISMPFLSYGGILADSSEISNQLSNSVVNIAKKLDVDRIEYRYIRPETDHNYSDNEFDPAVRKVRMILRLPENSDMLMASFKSKLRSQIHRPIKEGMIIKLGGIELITDFYRVFSKNMRDIGSPVHSKIFFTNITEKLKDMVKIGVVYSEEIPVAAGIVICYKRVVEIPWASSLKEYNKFSPNMLLYWSLLEYACNIGAGFFDFGRSTINEGTYRFKQQWGAEPELLNWKCTTAVGDPEPVQLASSKLPSRKVLEQLWKKMPLRCANYFGPKIRYKISL